MLIILRNFLVLLTFAPFTVWALSEEHFIRNVDASPGGKLVVDVDFGSIDVASGADGKVAVEAHRKIDFGDESKESAYLANAPITLTKDGNMVTIRSRGKNAVQWNFHHQEMDAKYTVRIPKKFEVGLRTNGGAINVSNIVGDLKANTSGGRMTFARLEGVLNAQTSGGAIEIQECNGPMDIETSGGRIRVADGKGSLKAHTSGGGIEVRSFSGDTEVRTSGGSLNLEKIAGNVVGKTSGGAIKASIPRAVLGDVRLETSAGNIDLSVPANAGLTIDARTSVGEVVSRLPIQASQADREKLRGTLNGGGKSVRLETSAGDITIKSAAELAER
jgi:hypothetical protein